MLVMWNVIWATDVVDAITLELLLLLNWRIYERCRSRASTTLSMCGTVTSDPDHSETIRARTIACSTCNPISHRYYGILGQLPSISFVPQSRTLQSND
ncbi:hypothetical protein KIN20_018362 [Parelaphostrongylus tenuis]|uniref:Uncharacterized protein n=1 Tax=Parelaphostrongylus tenuis TaxID=148309 RepID=A0AAD5QRE8_PARTN|nr:hypothetical protein KIN20_018362 [Parelaphostrongylus tenuis]